MIESQYTKNVHKKIPEPYKCWKINDNFQGGVPDAFYMNPTSKSRNLWAEYKFIKSLPIRPSTIIVPNLSELQSIWLENAHNAGETVRVIVGVEKVKGLNNAQGFILKPTEFNGITSEQARERLLDYNGIATVIKDLLK